ncbi:undecaprenyl-diphosphate phosphatase [Pelagibacterium sp. H642]|uniref:undecaprenyl-diphosphate phosphatase n=1 Tax=Pelagibacterium sp. H642 TaxID=1881069 RepID=UPI002815482D|nr:undecaprenyl-diphosphate phosphatase [Pelagibacterium sp. H642]WMT89704.1 undecaprenyl-diphosphate phosphatase [Pelagibacterium sp. H642]
MDFFSTAFLALVQGITEFLPISSSAHLILGRWLMDLLGIATSTMTPAEELALDIALHVGSLGAVIVYFWRDVLMLAMGLIDGVTGKAGPRFRTLAVVIAASLPIVVVAFLAKDLITESGRNLPIIAWTTLIFGVLLWFADRRPERSGDLETLSLRNAMIVGLAQCISIIPGVSRSGICMTAGRYVGLDRPLSARLAMLLSIPTILGAGVLAGYDLYKAGNAEVTGDAIFGGVLAFFAALASIALLMQWLQRQSYTPFVIYRIVLGVLLLGLLAAGLA